MRPAVRVRALILLLTLLGGGFGLPLLDALAFHSGAQASTAATPDQLGKGHTTGVAHALGCSVWTTAASGTGLPGPLLARSRQAPAEAGCPPSPPVLLGSQADHSPLRSRGPPAV